MKELTQIVRDAISGMFTTNVAEEVVKRVVEAVVEAKEGKILQ